MTSSTIGIILTITSTVTIAATAFPAAKHPTNEALSCTLATALARSEFQVTASPIALYTQNSPHLTNSHLLPNEQSDPSAYLTILTTLTTQSSTRSITVYQSVLLDLARNSPRTPGHPNLCPTWETNSTPNQTASPSCDHLHPRQTRRAASTNTTRRNKTRSSPRNHLPPSQIRRATNINTTRAKIPSSSRNHLHPS
ncbi:hypothetical protein F5X96DRAFT_2540 [Biscogniauxia mediterranea]|nr:hypothetical protein F5X96DRAFT_2540 [Biscogniauxia mediterranea]